MAWKFVLCELPTVALAGKPIGEIANAKDRRVYLQLNGTPTASFTVRMDNPMATAITDRNADVMLKVYQGSTLRFIGDCISAEEVGTETEGVSLACAFAGPFWRLTKRLKPTSTVGTSIIYSGNDSTDARDFILSDLLTSENAQYDTGIRIGSLTPMRSTEAGPWSFKPVGEAYQELAASFAGPKFETVSVYATQDNFVGTGSSAVNTRTSTSGHTWTTAGTGVANFLLDPGGNFVERNSGDDFGTNGKFAVIGSAMTDQVIQTGLARDGTVGAPITVQGLVGRYVDTNNFLRYIVQSDVAGSQFLQVVKFIGGTPTELYRNDNGTLLPANFSCEMRMTIDANGRWAVWWWPVADTTYQANPVMVGQDSDLATGGPLESGKGGFYDYHGGTGTCISFFDNFFTATPAESLDSEALEFELEPTEPTPDTNQSGVVGAGVKIAALNAAPRLGSDKPNVVFEYGDGNRSIKSYKRAISREALATRVYILPQGAEPPWTAGALVMREDADAIAARGLYEEVVQTDVGTGQGAVADFHLFFRKQARQVITFEPSAANPYVYGTDYEVGDSITGRAKVGGSSRFNGLFRVYAVEITIDDEGKESVSPTLTPDT